MPDVDWKPVTAEHWDDIGRLFGSEGAFQQCWCMWYRQTEGEHFSGRDGRNRRRFRELVRKGPPPGVLLYVDGEPAGWCSLGPREDFGRIVRSPSVKPVDDRPAWAIVCFFVAEEHRDKGLARALLDAAVSYARQQGVELLEAYPFDRRVDSMDAHTGRVAMFSDAGFVELHRRVRTRPIMRLELQPGGGG